MAVAQVGSPREVSVLSGEEPRTQGRPQACGTSPLWPWLSYPGPTVLVGLAVPTRSRPPRSALAAISASSPRPALAPVSASLAASRREHRSRPALPGSAQQTARLWLTFMSPSWRFVRLRFLPPWHSGGGKVSPCLPPPHTLGRGSGLFRVLIICLPSVCFLW